MLVFFFFSSRRRHTRLQGDWSSDVCSSDLESPPFEGDRRPLETTPQRIGAAVGAAPGQIDELRDHAFPTSPPTSASSIRTCGAPSVTGSGYWPAFPHPPPIWFQRKSAAI